MNQFFEFILENYLLSALWIFILILIIFSILKEKMRKDLIESPRAVELINKEEAIPLDVRTKEEFERGHITGSLNISIADIKQKLFKGLEKDKKRPIIIISANGMSSSEIQKLLIANNFENTFILKDGINSWKNSNLPLISKEKNKQKNKNTKNKINKG